MALFFLIDLVNLAITISLIVDLTISDAMLVASNIITSLSG